VPVSPCTESHARKGKSGCKELLSLPLLLFTETIYHGTSHQWVCLRRYELPTAFTPALVMLRGDSDLLLQASCPYLPFYA